MNSLADYRAFFILEMEICEIAHELANRPGWIGIPIIAKGREGAGTLPA
jgi:predicted trehalose synthase